MNRNNIYVQIYFVKFEERSRDDVSMREVISAIKDNDLEELVEQVRNASDRDAKKLKTQLPAFRPAVFFNPDCSQTATGIVQLDIDRKDNESLDFVGLKDEIKKIPECLYAFASPRGGLKVGILTDFVDTDGEESMRFRYKSAYFKVVQYTQSYLKSNVAFDDSVSAICWPCYMSHDPDVYFNDACAMLEINSQCSHEHYDHSEANTPIHDPAYIQKLLSYIPSGFDYSRRRTINFAVLRNLGREGIPLLLAHWNKDDKAELANELEDELKGCRFGSIGHLVNIAKQNGFKPAEGRARRNLKPTPTDIKLMPLMSYEDAAKKLSDTVRNFFKDGKSRFINISAGGGKTHTVLDVLAKEIPRDKKVLFLVPTHALAEDVERKFKSLRGNPVADMIEGKSRCPSSSVMTRQEIALQIFLKSKQSRTASDVTHLRGQDKLCQLRNGQQVQFDPKESIPWTYCSKSCLVPKIGKECQYIEQFRNSFDNIRIMTHQAWHQEQAAWFAGVRKDFAGGDVYPDKDGVWNPDYIIVDENIIKPDGQIHTDNGSRHQSISHIIGSMKHGVPLAEAIDEHTALIIADSLDNEEPRFPECKGTLESYQAAVKNWRASYVNNFSPILERLDRYVRTREPKYLLGIWLSDDGLRLQEIVQASARYANTPTLFLDATASEEVIRQVMPDVRFHSIKIRAKDDIHIFQLANRNISQSKLKEPREREELVTLLNNLILQRNYRNVGLITYKTIEGVEGDFDEYLASRLGIKNYGHFGALRGLNSYEDADCLLIVGRQFIGGNETARYSAAIFGEYAPFNFEYGNALVRMKSGACVQLNCSAPADGKHMAIHEHFSVAETKQAIGRARVVRGEKKDVYYFSNESLGDDIEISDFFYWDDYLKGKVLSVESLEGAKALGYFKNKPSEIMSVLGLPKEIFESGRDGITNELLSAGFKLATCKYRDKGSRWRDWSGFIFDESKFRKYVEGCGGNSVEVAFE